jgi:hypothetical protein
MAASLMLLIMLDPCGLETAAYFRTERAFLSEYCLDLNQSLMATHLSDLNGSNAYWKAITRTPQVEEKFPHNNLA